MEKIDPKTHHQLFLDDHVIERAERITRTVHQPRRCGPLITGGNQARTAPQWNSEKGIWEWWYFGADVYYAQSADGEHWELPSLGLYEFEGRTDNNIAWDPGDSAGRIYHVLRDEAEENPERRYKGLLSVQGRRPAVSADGFTWQALDARPVPSSDESQLAYDPHQRQFLATVKLATEWGRSVWLSTSEDFESFTEPTPIFHADEVDHQNCRQRVRKILDDPAYLSPPVVDDEDYIAEVYNMAVMPYQGLYVGFPVLFNPFGASPPPATNFTRINQIELSVSRDLHHWQRVADRQVFIGVLPYDGETYDTGQLLMAGQPIVREDGEIWCYYNALRWGSSLDEYRRFDNCRELFRLGVKPEHFTDTGALSLAKLRPDGFVSVDGGNNGTILTKPFDLKGEDVFINADASWGEVYVEIVDAETQKTIPGFWVPAELPPPFTGDATRHKVAWKHNHDLVFEKPVRLKFYLHQARLFSFWIE